MGHNKIYGICESKCKVETLSKDDMIKRMVLIATGKDPLTSCSRLYYNNTTIETIDYIETRFVTDMSSMFDGCTSLTTIPDLDTSNVTSMSFMFRSCWVLTSIPDLNTSKVIDMDFMFDGCSRAKTITFRDNPLAPEGSRWQFKKSFEIPCKIDLKSVIKVLKGLQAVESSQNADFSPETESLITSSDPLYNEYLTAKTQAEEKGWTISFDA